MITHAEYHAANPMPAVVRCCPAIGGAFSEPQIGAGRVHMVDDGIRPYRETIVSTDDYLSVLSKTAWRDSAYLADMLDVERTTAKGRMMSPTMVLLTERKKMSGRWVWRLK